MEPKNTGYPSPANRPGEQPQSSLGDTPMRATTSGQPAVIADIRPQPKPAAEPAAGPAPMAPATAAKPAKKPSFLADDAPDVLPLAAPAKKSSARDILSIIGVLGSALVLAFCLITFVFQSYQVDGPSMQTTLQNNDHLIVWKVPKTLAKLTGGHYIPHRGDVIIFNEPVADGVAQNKQLIKRVMALPGERITVKDGIVTVYNQEHPDGFQPDKTLPYGKVITTTPGNVDVTLHDNEVFVCGDNRTNSLDSRIFGPVDADQIIGKLVLRVLPLDNVKTF